MSWERDKIVRFMLFHLRDHELPRQEIIRIVDDAIEQAGRLRIEELRDLIRLIDIQLAVGPDMAASTQALLLSSLVDIEQDAGDRLDFIERHLLPKG